MRTRGARIAWLVVASVLTSETALAQHDHSAHGGNHDHHGTAAAMRSTYAATLGVIAASYDARLFTGDYQGAQATVRWIRGRFDAAISLPAYRLQKNGKTVYGIGDVGVHGQLTVLQAGNTALGVMLMLTIPTGNDQQGLGMGHVMVMPAAWISTELGIVALSAAVGVGRGIGDGNIHAEHGGGAWPLVDPMNFSEITLGGGADVVLAPQLRAGVRLSGAIAVPAEDGESRLAGGARIVWTEGRAETTAELHAGLIGDPFTFRGVLATTVRFQ